MTTPTSRTKHGLCFAKSPQDMRYVKTSETLSYVIGLLAKRKGSVHRNRRMFLNLSFARVLLEVVAFGVDGIM